MDENDFFRRSEHNDRDYNSLQWTTTTTTTTTTTRSEASMMTMSLHRSYGQSPPPPAVWGSRSMEEIPLSSSSSLSHFQSSSTIGSSTSTFRTSNSLYGRQQNHNSTFLLSSIVDHDEDGGGGGGIGGGVGEDALSSVDLIHQSTLDIERRKQKRDRRRSSEASSLMSDALVPSGAITPFHHDDEAFNDNNDATSSESDNNNDDDDGKKKKKKKKKKTEGGGKKKKKKKQKKKKSKKRRKSSSKEPPIGDDKEAMVNDSDKKQPPPSSSSFVFVGYPDAQNPNESMDSAEPVQQPSGDTTSEQDQQPSEEQSKRPSATETTTATSGVASLQHVKHPSFESLDSLDHRTEHQQNQARRQHQQQQQQQKQQEQEQQKAPPFVDTQRQSPLHVKPGMLKDDSSSLLSAPSNTLPLHKALSSSSFPDSSITPTGRSNTTERSASLARHHSSKRPRFPRMDSMLSDITFEWEENHHHHHHHPKKSPLSRPTWSPSMSQSKVIETISEETKSRLNESVDVVDLPFQRRQEDEANHYYREQVQEDGTEEARETHTQTSTLGSTIGSTLGSTLPSSSDGPPKDKWDKYVHLGRKITTNPIPSPDKSTPSRMGSLSGESGRSNMNSTITSISGSRKTNGSTIASKSQHSKSQHNSTSTSLHASSADYESSIGEHISHHQRPPLPADTARVAAARLEGEEDPPSRSDTDEDSWAKNSFVSQHGFTAFEHNWDVAFDVDAANFAAFSARGGWDDFHVQFEEQEEDDDGEEEDDNDDEGEVVSHDETPSAQAKSPQKANESEQGEDDEDHVDEDEDEERKNNMESEGKREAIEFGGVQHEEFHNNYGGHHHDYEEDEDDYEEDDYEEDDYVDEEEQDEETSTVSEEDQPEIDSNWNVPVAEPQQHSAAFAADMEWPVSVFPEEKPIPTKRPPTPAAMRINSFVDQNEEFGAQTTQDHIPSSNSQHSSESREAAASFSHSDISESNTRSERSAGAFTLSQSTMDDTQTDKWNHSLPSISDTDFDKLQEEGKGWAFFEDKLRDITEEHTRESGSHRVEQRHSFDSVAAFMSEAGVSNESIKSLEEQLKSVGSERFSGFDDLDLSKASSRRVSFSTDDNSKPSATVAKLPHSQEAAHDVLVMYLMSQGTDSQMAQSIATSFVSHHKRKNFEPPLSPFSAATNHSADSEVPPVTTQSLGDESVSRVRSKDSVHSASATVTTNTNQSIGASAASITPAVEPPTERELEERRLRRNRLGRHIWIRATRPGAISVRGRAFGAPLRPQRFSRNRSEDTTSLVSGDEETGGMLASGHLVQATAVRDDDDVQIVYAETSPLSIKHMLTESRIRKILIIGCLMVVGAVVAVSILVFRGSGSDEASTQGQTMAPSASPSMQPTFVLDDVLERAALFSNRTVLETMESPQRRAVGWLSSVDEVLTSASSDAVFAQRFALLVLYFSTNGKEWVNHENWLDPRVHECEWSSAVSCTLLFGRQTVSALDVANTGLEGTLPSELALLTSLEYFRCARNLLRGPFPEEIFDLNRISVLDIRENEFSGRMSSKIGGLESLVYLDFSFNEFSGELPDSFYSLSSVRIVELEGNRLSGTLSDRIASLASASKFNLRSNQFSGTLAEMDFNSLPPLEFLHLDDNLLSGSLPEWVGGLVTRQEITISNNMLTGEFPYIPADLLSNIFSNRETIKLRRLDVSHNNFTGNLIGSTGFLPFLEYADVSHNSLTGPFLFNNGPFIALKEIYASDNLFTGEFPPTLPPNLEILDLAGNKLRNGFNGLCDAPSLLSVSADRNKDLGGSLSNLFSCNSKLHRVTMSDCGLSGSLPPAIGQSSDLVELVVGENSLSGTIPSAIGLLTTLHKLDLSSNALTGTVPSEMGKMSSLASLHLDNNDLEGALPSTLNQLRNLESLRLVGNDKLRGTAPCPIIGTAMDTADIGCNLECFCCSNRPSFCGVAALATETLP